MSDDYKRPERPWRLSDDYIRPERPRFNRFDARYARRRRARNVFFGLAALFVVWTLINSAAPKRLKAHRTGARVADGAVIKPADQTVIFSNVSGSPLELALPAAKEEVLGIGYHQAYNLKALSLLPRLGSMGQATTQSVLRAVGAGRLPSFVMTSRGRGSALDSSVDVAFKAGGRINSPVTGQVVGVVPYLLYGRINDIRIDIMADGCRDFKVAITHLDKPEVAVGQKVEAGITPLATVRPLGISSQIDQYLGKAVNHIHIQANPLEAQPVATNGR